MGGRQIHHDRISEFIPPFSSRWCLCPWYSGYKWGSRPDLLELLIEKKTLDDDTEDMASLLQKLSSIGTFHGRPDARTWKQDKSGTFTLKSCFAQLAGGEDDPRLEAFKSIWKIHSPSKVKFVCWLISLGKMNVYEVLQRRRPNVPMAPQWCIMCKQAAESIDHLFLHYPWLRCFGLKCWMNNTSVGNSPPLFRLFQGQFSHQTSNNEEAIVENGISSYYLEHLDGAQLKDLQRQRGKFRGNLGHHQM